MDPSDLLLIAHQLASGLVGSRRGRPRQAEKPNYAGQSALPTTPCFTHSPVAGPIWWPAAPSNIAAKALGNRPIGHLTMEKLASDVHHRRDWPSFRSGSRTSRPLLCACSGCVTGLTMTPCPCSSVPWSFSGLRKPTMPFRVSTRLPVLSERPLPCSCY